MANIFSAPRYRLRAAEYGIQIRFAQPSFELVRLALVIVGLVVAVGFGAGKVPDLPSAVWFWGAIGGSFLVAGYATIRYLGSLSQIMNAAAWSDEGAARIRRDMEAGMRNDFIYGQLIELYRPVVEKVNDDLRNRSLQRRMRLVEMEGGRGQTQRYAAVGIPTDGSEALETLLGPIEARGEGWRTQRFRDLAESRQRLMRKWRSAGNSDRPMEDERGDNYCVTQLDFAPDGSLRLGVGVATYGEIVRSCDALINELALFAYLTGPLGKRWRLSPFRRRTLRMGPAGMLRRLPWRNRVHRENRARPVDFRLDRLLRRKKRVRAGHLFVRPRDRAAGLGIAVVTLDRKGADGDEKAYLGARSSLVGTYPGTNHVVPAGMCNTYGTHFEPQGHGEPPQSDYLETAMQCEFLEEWFGEKELENNLQRNWSERVRSKWMEKSLAAGAQSPVKEEMKFTGIAFDLLNLRPEVCATALVDTSDGKLNWEFDAVSFDGPLRTVGRVKRAEIVQSGAAALMLAQMSRPVPRPQVAAAGAGD